MKKKNNNQNTESMRLTLKGSSYPTSPVPHPKSTKVSSFIFSFIFITWRIIILEYCSGFFQTLTCISHGFTCIPYPEPPPTSRSTRSLWVSPVYWAWALVSGIQRGLAISFTIDNIHVSMLFSQNTPPLPSPTEFINLFCTSVSLFLFCI